MFSTTAAQTRPHIARFVALVLLAVAPAIYGQAPPAAEAPPEQPFFSMPCHEFDIGATDTFGWGVNDPFQREMLRQAVLLSAREEFGLITRDPLLGERMPDGAEAYSCDYLFTLQRDEPIQISLFRAELLRGPYEINAKAGRIDHYRPLVWAAERFSREGAVTALTDLGFVPNPTPLADPAPLPAKIEQRLYDMDVITQFYLVRELHAMIRQAGENRERLSAISMAYSNLAQLTRYRVDHSSRAFHARAFLYAGRAAQRDPDRPEAYWALAYAWMMLDLPGYGTGPLNNAHAKNDALDLPIEEPAWMALQPLYWRYDSIALIQRSREPGPLAELAAILASAAAESSPVNGLHRTVIENCLAINPDTQRGFDTCFAAEGWWLKSDEYAAARHGRFHEAIPRLLDGHADQIPAELFAIQLTQNPSIGEHFTDIAQIAWALQDSASNHQPVEFSDAALGHQIEAILAGSAIDLYALPSQDSKGRQTNPAVWHPIIASLSRHRYATLFELFNYSTLSPVQQRNAISRRVRWGDINPALGNRLLLVLPDPYTFENVQGIAAWHHLYYQMVQTVPDMNFRTRALEDPEIFRMFASWLHEAAPNAPMRTSTYIRFGRVDAEQVRQRVQRHLYMPGVLVAGGEWYQANGMPDEAFDLFWRASEAVPDKELESRTAELALQLGELDIWLDMMLRVRDSSENIPPYINSELLIAATYMEGQQWDRALHWAQLAYDNRPWDPETVHLAWCMHKTGQTDEAIAVLLRRDRRTGQDMTLRLCYQLNLQDQLEHVVADYIEHNLPRETRRDPRAPFALESHLMILRGQTQAAVPKLIQSWEKFHVTNDAMRLMILSKQFGDHALHGQMLNAMVNDRGNEYRSSVAAHMARIILETPQVPPTDAEIRAALDDYGRWSAKAYIGLNFGWYLIASGETQRGQAILIHDVLDNKYVPLFSYERYMAAIVLRQSGYDMDSHPWRFPDAHDWPRP